MMPSTEYELLLIRSGAALRRNRRFSRTNAHDWENNSIGISSLSVLAPPRPPLTHSPPAPRGGCVLSALLLSL